MSLEFAHSQIYIWPFAMAVLLIFLIILWRKAYSSSYLICCFVFGVYLLFALDKVFFPVWIDPAHAHEVRRLSWVWGSSINLIPFKFDFSFIPHIVFMQIFQNILLTIPFGFGINFVARTKAKDFLWIAPAIGFGIETTQLAIALMLGYPYRIIDINDAILNALGVLIGYGLFRVFAWLYILGTQEFGIRLGGLAAYIHDESLAHSDKEKFSSTLNERVHIFSYALLMLVTRRRRCHDLSDIIDD